MPKSSTGILSIEAFASLTKKNWRRPSYQNITGTIDSHPSFDSSTCMTSIKYISEIIKVCSSILNLILRSKLIGPILEKKIYISFVGKLLLQIKPTAAKIMQVDKEGQVSSFKKLIWAYPSKTSMTRKIYLMKKNQANKLILWSLPKNYFETQSITSSAKKLMRKWMKNLIRKNLLPSIKY